MIKDVFGMKFVVMDDLLDLQKFISETQLEERFKGTVKNLRQFWYDPI